MTCSVSDEVLHECYKAAACIVVKYGDKYLPIFERLDEEVQFRSAKHSLKQKAKDIADNLNEQEE